MIIKNIRQTAVDGIRELSADLLYETEGATEHLFLRMPDTGRANPRPGDTFFTAFALPSMALGERLYLDAPVSTDIYEAATTNTFPLLRKWFPRLHRLEPEIEFTSPPASEAQSKTGVMFSGGVDSWHSLAECYDEIDSLIHIRGFEILLKNETTWELAHESVRRIGAQQNKEVIAISTNFREATFPHIGLNPAVGWRNFGADASYGHWLCAMGLALRPALGSLIVPSSWRTQIEQVASSPFIEPRLSVDSLQIKMIGAEISRLQKMKLMTTERPEFAESLRVCTDHDFTPHGTVLNCGKCLKCFRTQFELRVLNTGDIDRLFDKRADIRQCRYEKPRGSLRQWEGLAAEALERGDTEAYKAVRTMLDQPVWLRKLRRSARKAARALTGRSDS